jgi:hypothetical protein
MNKFICFFLGLISFAVIISCGKDEEDLSGTIAGLVTDYTNANSPIAGATVTLSTKGLTKTTGNDGRFEFAGIEPGTYTLQIAANGFQTTTKQVTVYAGQKAICDVQLSKGATSVDINPQTLTFGKDVEQLSFTITNNSNQSLTYTISNAPDYIEVTPASGTVVSRGRQAVSVHVLNRSSITSNRTGQLTVNIGNDSYIVSIAVTNNTSTDPNQGNNGGDDPDNPPTSGDIAVTRSLLAYYSFDGKNANNDYRTSNNGSITGEPKFLADTPNGKGFSMSLESMEYVTIPNNLVSQKSAFSISFWVKNFGTGPIFTTMDGHYPQAPSFVVQSDNKPQLYYNGGSKENMTYTLQPYQSSGWHMLTYTASQADRQIVLYVDGLRVDNKAVNNVESRGNKMLIGGNGDGYWNAWCDPMQIDNVRIHSITLTDKEVKQIYDSEK